MNEYRTSRPGTVFKPETGKLYVFRPHNISVMIAWPKPRAWRKTSSHPTWVHLRPAISVPERDIEGLIHQLETLGYVNRQLLLPFCGPPVPADENGQLFLPCCVSPKKVEFHGLGLAWLRWYGTIPLRIRGLVSRFPNRHWHMLSFLARCGEPAVDLSVSNPALAYALASNWVFHRPAVQRPLRSARALLQRGRKQREVLAWLGFPGTEAARKMLARVTPQAVNISALLYLRRGMNDPAMFKAVSHLKRVNAGVIRIATDPELLPLAAPTLLDEIACSRAEDGHAKTAYMLRDSAAMFRLLFPDRRWPQPTRRLYQVVKLHDELVEALNRAKYLDKEIPFPPPPLEGSDIIVPITNARDLVEEGRIQHNCVATYMERVALRQRAYIYRVLFPERCTLALQRHRNSWIFSELKAACNESPSEATYQAVEDWFVSQAGGVLKPCGSP